MNSELQEKGVSNNEAMRGHNTMDWVTEERKAESRLGFIHGVYHQHVAKAKERTGKKGAI